MIKVIEGKKHEDFVKDMCVVMNINDKHNINFYINESYENNMSVDEDNAVKLTIKENENTKYNIKYMFQKYIFLYVCNEENKDKRVLKIMDNYLSNYNMLTLLICLLENTEDLILKKEVIKLKEYICNVCKSNIIKFNNIFENDDSIDEDTLFNLIGASCACFNVLQKFDSKSMELSNNLLLSLKKINWHNINEMYSEIEQAFYSYIE